MPAQERKRRWRRIVLVLGLALVLLVGAAAAFVVTRQEGDVTNPDVEFRDEPADTPEPGGRARRAGRAKDRPGRPLHLGALRLHARPPPLSPARAAAPPAVPGDVAVHRERPARVPARDRRPAPVHPQRLRVLFGIRKQTGDVLWRRKLGALAAASPAYAERHRLRGAAPAGEERRGRGPGARRRAERHARGRSSGAARLPAAASPRRCSRRPHLLRRRSGTVYAMDADSGRVRWRFKAEGPVKGGLALSDGKLYFGDYGGRVYAVRLSDGSSVWRASTSGTRFGLGAGNFYSTPAVAYGRVYIGNTDGRMYSFSADDGRLAWSRAPAATSTRPRRSPRCRAGARSSTPAPTAAGSTRSTPARAPSAGRAAATAGSRAARPSSATSSTTRTSGRSARSASTRGPGARCSSSSAAPTTRSCPTARRSSSPATTRSTPCAAGRGRPQARGRAERARRAGPASGGSAAPAREAHRGRPRRSALDRPLPRAQGAAARGGPPGLRRAGAGGSTAAAGADQRSYRTCVRERGVQRRESAPDGHAGRGQLLLHLGDRDRP